MLTNSLDTLRMSESRHLVREDPEFSAKAGAE